MFVAAPATSVSARPRTPTSLPLLVTMLWRNLTTLSPRLPPSLLPSVLTPSRATALWRSTWEATLCSLLKDCHRTNHSVKFPFFVVNLFSEAMTSLETKGKLHH